MLDKEDIGKFYVSLRRGQRGEFITRLINDAGGSYCNWRNKLVAWSKGAIDSKTIPQLIRTRIEEVMAEKHWETMTHCTD